MLIHYFITSLKPVVFSEPPPLSLEAFLTKAEDCLGEIIIRDLKQLKALHLAQEGLPTRKALKDLQERAKSRLLKSWALELEQAYEMVAYLSCRHAQIDKAKYRSQLGSKLSDLAITLNKNFASEQILGSAKSLNEKYADTNPLVIEESFWRENLKFLDENLKLDPFSYDQVLVYFINLQICHRFWSFEEKKGQRILDEMLANVREVARNV